MPTTIIIRIVDDAHAREVMSAGAKDLATDFLPDALIRADSVSICYRSPEEEARAAAGEIEYVERRDVWSR